MLYHCRLLTFLKKRLIDGVILNHPVNMNHKTLIINTFLYHKVDNVAGVGMIAAFCLINHQTLRRIADFYDIYTRSQRRYIKRELIYPPQ